MARHIYDPHCSWRKMQVPIFSEFFYLVFGEYVSTRWTLCAHLARYNGCEMWSGPCTKLGNAIYNTQTRKCHVVHGTIVVKYVRQN